MPFTPITSSNKPTSNFTPLGGTASPTPAAKPPSSSFLSGISQAIGGGILDVGKGFFKQIGGDLQGFGQAAMRVVGLGDKNTGLKTGFSPETLQTSGIAQNIGALGGDVAEILSQPEIALDKIGFSGLAKLVEKGVMSAENLSKIEKVVTSKWGRKGVQVLQDFALGAGTKASENVVQGQPLTQGTLQSGVTTALGGQVVRGITNKLLPSEEGKVSNTLNHIKANEDTMIKSERHAAINEGRLKPTPFGGKEYVPSKTEQRASEILQGKTTGNPIKDLAVTKEEIKTRGKEVESFLSNNAKPITAAEDKNLFDAVKTKAAKTMTKAELKAYGEQIKLFSKQLVGRGGFNTENYYKALKSYETDVASRLPRGKAAILEPTSAAKLQAVSDIRKAVRNLIGSKYLTDATDKKSSEFTQRMFDLASLYDVQDTLITKADQLEGNSLTRVLTSKPAKVIGAIGGAGAVGAGLYEGGKAILGK